MRNDPPAGLPRIQRSMEPLPTGRIAAASNVTAGHGSRAALVGVMTALGLLGACGGAAAGGAGATGSTGARPATPPATVVTPAAPPVAKPALTGPVHERAAQLRRAGDLLDQAQASLDAGNRSGADVLFSTAELLTGPEAVAAVAPRFREGAPPRVTDAPVKVEAGAPQPATVGNSDDEEEEEARAPDAPKPPPKPPARGSLTGTLRIAGATGGSLALVTLEPIGRTWKPRRAKQRIMEQRARKFAPQLMLIPTGSTVQFPNFDTIFHNVFSTSNPNPFDLGLYKQGEARSIQFPKEGIVRIGCSIHANMAATIVVIDAPHYVIPGGDGAFRFRSLAPGRYKLRAWSERSKAPITQEITVAIGDNQVEVGVDGDAPAGPLDDKFGAKRGK